MEYLRNHRLLNLGIIKSWEKSKAKKDLPYIQNYNNLVFRTKKIQGLASIRQ